MPAYPKIDSYYEQLCELIEFGGVANEESIRLAFVNCLSAYCSECYVPSNQALQSVFGRICVIKGNSTTDVTRCRC